MEANLTDYYRDLPGNAVKKWRTLIDRLYTGCHDSRKPHEMKKVMNVLDTDRQLHILTLYQYWEYQNHLCGTKSSNEWVSNKEYGKNILGNKCGKTFIKEPREKMNWRTASTKRNGLRIITGLLTVHYPFRVHLNKSVKFVSEEIKNKRVYNNIIFVEIIEL